MKGNMDELTLADLLLGDYDFQIGDRVVIKQTNEMATIDKKSNPGSWSSSLHLKYHVKYDVPPDYPIYKVWFGRNALRLAYEQPHD